MKKVMGYTLIEVVIFLVIMGIAMAGIMLSFQTALSTTPENSRATMALNLTQGRLDIIIGQYYQRGFASFTDICSSSPGLALCSLPSNYSISSNITNNGSTKTIEVTTSYSGTIEAKLSTIVANV